MFKMNKNLEQVLPNKIEDFCENLKYKKMAFTKTFLDRTYDL